MNETRAELELTESNERKKRNEEKVLVKLNLLVVRSNKNKWFVTSKQMVMLHQNKWLG
jgi:hypothetical protein